MDTVGGEDVMSTVKVGVAGGVHDTVKVDDASVAATPPVCHARTQALSDCPDTHGAEFGAASGETVPATTPEVHKVDCSGAVDVAGVIHV